MKRKIETKLLNLKLKGKDRKPLILNGARQAKPICFARSVSGIIKTRFILVWKRIWRPFVSDFYIHNDFSALLPIIS